MGTSPLRAGGCGAAMWAEVPVAPAKPPYAGQHAVPIPVPCHRAGGNGVFLLPSVLSSIAPSHAPRGTAPAAPTPHTPKIPVPAAPGRTAKNWGLPKTAGRCPTAQLSTHRPAEHPALPPSPALASVTAQGHIPLAALLAGPGHPCPPGWSHGRRRCHPSLGAVPGAAALSPFANWGKAAIATASPRTAGDAGTATGIRCSTARPQLTPPGGGQGVGQSSPKVPSLPRAPPTHGGATPGPHGRVPHGAGDNPSRCWGQRRGQQTPQSLVAGGGGGSHCTPAPSRLPVQGARGDPALLPLPLHPDPTAKG